MNVEEWKQLPAIEGDRTRLRWIEDEDVPALFALFGNDDVTRYWSWPAHKEISQAATLLDDIRGSFEQRDLFQWGVVTQGSDHLIGTCTLARVDFSNGRAELGYALNRTYWGAGLMRDALTALIDFTFGPLALRRLEADVDPRNERSVRLLEQLGFVREGLLRERWHVNGEIQDALFFGLLAREWQGSTVE